MSLSDKWYCDRPNLTNTLSASYWTNLLEGWEKYYMGDLPLVAARLSDHLYLSGGGRLYADNFPNHPWHKSIAPGPMQAFDTIKLDDKYITTAPEPMYTLAKVAPPGGVICCRCGQRNPDAGPNMKDGKYKCYSCR